MLYQPYAWSWNGRQKPGQKSFCEVPVFSVQDGKFASLYSNLRFTLAQDTGDAPPHTAAQLEAIKLAAELVHDPEFHFAVEFEKGDFQLMNGFVTSHGRTAFEDAPEENKVRHLYRLWLSVPNSRPLAPSLATIFKDHHAGALRGGYAVPPE